MLVILFQTLRYVQLPGFDLTVVGEEFLLTQTVVFEKGKTQQDFCSA